MGLSVAYKSETLMTALPAETNAGLPKQKQKSLYTVSRERRFERSALKKYADRIAAIQEHYPNWTPNFK